jgi:hypothetical protein
MAAMRPWEQEVRVMLRHRTVWTVMAMLVSSSGYAAEPPRGDNQGSFRPDQPPAVAPAPSGGAAATCGAVAYTSDGAFGAAFGMQSCDEAHRLAVAECVKVSTEKKDCGEGVITRHESWFHIQFCQRDRNWTTRVTTQTTLSETNREASEWAKKSKFGSEYCRLVPNGLFHSGGLHTKL